jgi:MFS family permease
VIGTTSVLFAASTLVGIALYVRVAAWAGRRWPPGTCVAVGLGLMGAGFVPVAISAPLLPAATSLAPAAGLPVLAGTVVFTLGIALANPFTMQLLPVVGSERLIGTYYGFYYLVSALVAAVVSTAAGALLDVSGAGWRAVAPAALLIVGLAGAAGTALMQRRGLLSDPSLPIKPQIGKNKECE